MGEINDWNVAAGSNNDPAPNGAPEGMFPSSVNNTMRENMAVLARWNKDINGSVVVAGTDTYTATINATTGFALYDGYMFCGTFTNAPTGPATLNLTVVATPLGPQPIVDSNGAALTGGEWAAGAKVSFKYDGTSFRMDSILSAPSTATTTTEGIAELATQAEVDAGTVTDKIVTPETLAAYSGLGFTLNRIINGLPAINQRGAQASITSAGSTTYFADRWAYNAEAGSTAVVNLDIVDGYLEADVTTADTAIANNAGAGFSHRIEGYNVSDFGLGTASAQTVTLSFKHKHTKTGTYCVNLFNASFNRSYIFEYTQSVSDAEETHSETITLDTAGAWNVTNGIGLNINFSIGMGADRQAAKDVWSSNVAYVTSNQVNGLDSTSNYFRIKEVQLEIGSSATDFESEDYGTTLNKCQRYYEKVQYKAIGFHATGGGQTFYQHVSYSEKKRSTPTVSLTGANNTNCTSSVPSSSENGSRLDLVSSGAGGFFSLDGVLSVDAEL